MDLISVAIGAAGAAFTLLITFGTWVVLRISTLDKQVAVVESQQKNDRDAKDRILETLDKISEALWEKK